MSTAQLMAGRRADSAEVELTGSRTVPALPLVIAGALLVVVLYAAFDHGAVALGVDARLHVAIAAIAAVACAGWLGTGTLRFAAPGVAFLGVGLLAAFACWCGITVVWSVAPDQSWIELNRAISYLLVLCLAIAVGASHERGVEFVARGFLLVSLAVTAYALGQKLLPGLHIAGVFDLNQTGPLPRLQAPLGYWNALALFVALGVPSALALAVDRRRTPARRIGGAAAVEVMLLTIGLTYSRGGILALAVALLVAVTMGGAWLRAALWLLLSVVAAIPPLVVGLSSHALTSAGIGLGRREGAGAILALVLAASIVALVFAGKRLSVFEHTLTTRPEVERRTRRVFTGGLVALVVCAVIALAVSPRGLSGNVSHAWSNFTSTRTASNVNPSRLLSADSENRWVWWKEATSAFADRPLGGWGAGSFGVVHLIYRRNTLPVQQPHSVPLQFLAETGVIGALLALAAFGALLAAAVAAVRRSGARRLLPAALLAAVVGYLVHSLYDWDWNIPAVTLPALVFLGVLAGSAARSGGALAGRAIRSGGGRHGSHLLWLAWLTLWLCLFAISALVPSIASNEANAALIQGASSSPGALRHAMSSARLASKLDPLSDAGLRAEASIAVRRGQLARARNYLEEGLEREPSDTQTWLSLAEVDLVRGDMPAARGAALRVLALDPMGPAAKSIRQARRLSQPPWGTPPGRK